MAVIWEKAMWEHAAARVTNVVIEGRLRISEILQQTLPDRQ